MPSDFKQIEYLARLMDDRFELFGFKFGLNFIVGLLPEVGDFISTGIALYIFGLAIKNKIPFWVVVRMFINIIIYFLVGLIPWLGDIFGAWWKPNRKNLELLKKQLNKNSNILTV